MTMRFAQHVFASDRTRLYASSRARGLLLILVGGLWTAPVNADESTLRLRPSDPPAVNSVVSEAATLKTTPTVKRKPVKVVTSSLAIVLGGFALLLVIFRKGHSQASPAIMDTLGKVRVTPRVELQLVRLGQRILVLHITSNNVQTVAEITDPQEVQSLLKHCGNADELLSHRVGDLLRDSDANTAPLSSELARG